MNEQTVNAIKEAMLPVAEKIGQGAEYGWEVVVRQQYIEGIALLIGAFFALAGLVAGSIVWKRALNDCSEGFTILGFFLTLGSAVALVVCTITGVLNLLNPAYYALEFFINLGKTAI